MRKLGSAMGLPTSGDAAPAENSGQDETEDVGNEDESIVHQTASVGDVEVRITTIFKCISFKTEILQIYRVKEVFIQELFCLGYCFGLKITVVVSKCSKIGLLLL